METKILASLMVIGLVASAIGMGTYAYFSDTETSTGNTFTAGSIDLKIDLDRDGQGIWDLKDLGAGDKFFDYSDIKPGDSGELTVSLHVYNNDAWACFYIKPTTDSDNSCTEPESEEETDCTDTGDGELDNYLMFRIWEDDGDNIYENEEILLTYCGSTGSEWCYLSDIDPNGEVWPLGKLTASTTYYFGIEWKLPWETGNEVQTDKWSADVWFYVEQAKNNENFVCPPIQ